MDAATVALVGLALHITGSLVGGGIFLLRYGIKEGARQQRLNSLEKSVCDLRAVVTKPLQCDLHGQRLDQFERRIAQTEDSFRDVDTRLSIFREEVARKWRNGNANPHSG